MDGGMATSVGWESGYRDLETRQSWHLSEDRSISYTSNIAVYSDRVFLHTR